MSDITTLLAQIKSAVRGDEVRDSIHDAISQCYADGKAGVIDLGARGLIESAIAVNESQETDIIDLQGRVSQLEGGSGEGTTEETTTTFDTCKILFGHATVTLAPRLIRYTLVRFPSAFDTVPYVAVLHNVQSSADGLEDKIAVGVVNDSVTASQFRFFAQNGSTNEKTVNVDWIAIAPVTTSINTDITIPSPDDLSESEIQSIEALFD